MKAVINRHLFTQTDLDSGALTVHGTLIHSFSRPGNYLATILREEDIVREFPLTVELEHASQQVDIDLRSLDEPTSLGGRGRDFSVGPGGRAFFYVSAGRGGYAVVVRGEEQKRSIEFDSRVLRKGDYFVANLIRPGSYSMVEANSGSRGQITVDYPEPRRPRRPPLQPVSVVVAGGRFKPDKVKLQPMQGLVFVIQSESRLCIVLEKPDDRPRRPRR